MVVMRLHWQRPGGARTLLSIAERRMLSAILTRFPDEMINFPYPSTEHCSLAWSLSCCCCGFLLLFFSSLGPICDKWTRPTGRSTIVFFIKDSTIHSNQYYISGSFHFSQWNFNPRKATVLSSKKEWPDRCDRQYWWVEFPSNHNDFSNVDSVSAFSAIVIDVAPAYWPQYSIGVLETTVLVLCAYRLSSKSKMAIEMNKDNFDEVALEYDKQRRSFIADLRRFNSHRG